ncbi:hypothetical protein DHEL01_v211366, partial [Diaporthe helianthi]
MSLWGLRSSRRRHMAIAQGRCLQSASPGTSRHISMRAQSQRTTPCVRLTTSILPRSVRIRTCRIVGLCCPPWIRRRNEYIWHRAGWRGSGLRG